MPKVGSAVFNVSSLGTTPFTYQWQKDGVNIPGETSAVLTIDNALPADGGNYSVIVYNSAGNATSNVAALTVIANSIPIAEILNPGSGTTYAAGTSVEFSGTGSDKEDGALPATAFRWQINFHHDAHNHDEPPIEGVTSGTFLIPNEGETSDNVWYRIILTVTDSNGGSAKDSVDILPRKSTITLTTLPPGLEVTVDGQPFSTPVVVTSVEGILRTFGAVSPQMKDDAEYAFESWSNGGDVIQTFPTPTEDLQLMANFSTVVGTEREPWSGKAAVLYPNPTNGDAITIKILLKQPESLSIQLINFLSQEIVSSKQNLSAGEHNIPFHFGKRSKGIYSVIIKTSSSAVDSKIGCH